ncbi:G-protein coupled receptors family 1 profile domain-containing protein [Caenorhabditis elegans]|uniref:G-protein coupled receptors family 1 profile domain-containing protein n=1 Tax=Caenorhabditis elegans TaxID=6239 RepID=O16239_CAEEL|nr:G-protein coupled receptors family 1 profile domain-containing protein [Caenorhabditis elegans]CCD64391.1 G-protein coupled receptors family 1 profile domain-containing protein [Caenorhabditis elegans]|eukprot:NP_504339.1 Serpentine Receptor, class SX [Caenorhabditis elegans]
MSVESVNNIIVTVYKFSFFVIGIVGNSLFIHLIFKKQKLRSRSTLLQCVQCAFQNLCLVGTILVSALTFITEIRRDECFIFISFYIFSQAAQGLLMLLIMIDVLIFVKFPLFYRNLANWKYFSSCFIFVFLYSSTVILYGYLTTNDDIIHACNPLFAFALTSRYTFKSSMLILSLLTLIIYIVMIRIFKNKNKSRNKDSIKIMRRLQLSVVIFVFTWLVSQALAMVFLHDDGSIHWEKIVFVHNSFFIVLSYSNTFYVTMWKSGEYRKNFRSVWGLNRKVIVASRNTMNLS